MCGSPVEARRRGGVVGAGSRATCGDSSARPALRRLGTIFRVGSRNGFSLLAPVDQIAPVDYVLAKVPLPPSLCPRSLFVPTICKGGPWHEILRALPATLILMAASLGFSGVSSAANVANGYNIAVAPASQVAGQSVTVTGNGQDSTAPFTGDNCDSTAITVTVTYFNSSGSNTASSTSRHLGRQRQPERAGDHPVRRGSDERQHTHGRCAGFLYHRVLHLSEQLGARDRRGFRHHDDRSNHDHNHRSANHHNLNLHHHDDDNHPDPDGPSSYAGHRHTDLHRLIAIAIAIAIATPISFEWRWASYDPVITPPRSCRRGLSCHPASLATGSPGQRSAAARSDRQPSRRARASASRWDGTVLRVTRRVRVVASAPTRSTILGGSVQ